MGFLDFAGLSHFLDKIKTITIPISFKGAANGVAELDANGKVPSSQLPSYVDDILNYDDINYANWPEWESGASYSVGDNVKVTSSEDPAAVTGYICIVANSSASILNTEWREATKFPAQGESGIIYIADVTNITYRWGGSSYVAIGSAGGGSLLYILSFSILTTDWESITGGYGASITDSHVGTATEEIVVFDDSLTDLNANIFWEKNGSTHTMTFTSSSIPSDTISGKVFVFGDASGDVAYALPAVTSSDNGKVLGVVGGAWSKMSAPSGREWYIVTNADDTPFGVTWEKDGQTITGTLVASENTKTKIYFVPSVTVEGKDAYAEWVTISPTSGSYVWERFGTTSIDVSLFGALAYKNTASGSFTPVGSIAVNPANGQGTSYTPEGTVSTPLISVASAGTTATIKNPTKQTVAKTLQTAAPGETAPSNPITYFSVVGERLKLHQIGYTTGDSIATEDVTVKTGDASYQASTPTFSGTAKKLAFNGTAGTVTVE